MGSGQHLLIVDNDEDVADVLRSVLEQAGFQVTIVKSYGEAVRTIDREMPAGILTELMLPDVSGLDLVRYIRDRQDGTDVPLLVVTGATAGYQMGQAIDAGADVFMCKPVGIDEVLRGVGKVIE
jgi:DNA-binding response OmpR family regulator